MSRAFPIAYSISRGEGLRLDIALVETGRLLLHEETIPDILEALTRRIEEDGVLRAPVIVDRKTLVVLDGMHRVKALRLLGCRFACTCLVDYMNPEIKVDRWCRTVRPLDARKAAEVAEDLGLRLDPRPPRGASRSSGAASAIRFKDSSFDLVAPRPGLLPALSALRELELRLRAMGSTVDYETERSAEEKLAEGEVDAVICPPVIGKEEVIDVARRGQVFIFKATRHVIPARPLGVDVPLSLLRDPALSVEEANRRLSAHLHRKRLRRAPPGASWGDRRYDEDLYVFEDP
ncbi:ABC transporter ATP-binding protein [Candidatus Bathyarchaeota archaeon]|nr:MAG: ABC transporter ATP-binding protein [Candidatus Bathyarchaeota archaeon]